MTLKQLFAIVIWLMPSLLMAQKENINNEPYPYGNPVIRHMYTADASPHVMPDGRVWMVTSVDHEKGGGYATMHSYHTFSSADMVHWTDHGEVLNILDVLGTDTEPEGEDWALWAPDMIYRNGKYYLYFPIRILYTDHGYDEKKRKTKSYIAVAVADAPDQKFTVINPCVEGTKGIDPSVFIDDNDQPYLYFGSHYGAKLQPNMYELEGQPVRMEVDDEHFMEAIWMDKKDGKYCVSYHSHYHKPIDPEQPNDPNRLKSLLCYGVSDQPLGPFTFGGTLNHELGQHVVDGPKLPGYDYVPWRLYQSNHGGIVEYHGQDYLFYHTSALSSWRQDQFEGPGTWTQRSVCIDKLNYSADGEIIPVQQTLQGVDAVEIHQPYNIDIKKGDVLKGCQMKRGRMVTNSETACMIVKDIDLGTGYYYLQTKSEQSYDAKLEVRLDGEDGVLLGTINLAEGRDTSKGRVHETFLRGANSTQTLCFVIKNNTGAEIELNSIRFIAGNAK